jgi:hypothetical protein
MSNRPHRDAWARPSWLSEQLYPFEGRYADVRGSRVHYVDAGAGGCGAAELPEHEPGIE